jgi:hypothetical protein
MKKKTLLTALFIGEIILGLVIRYYDEQGNEIADTLTWVWAIIFLIGGVLLFDLLSWIIKLFK